MVSDSERFRDWLITIKEREEARDGVSLTITEFGRRLGVNQASISAWFNQTRKPSYDRLMDLAERTGDYSVLAIFGYAQDVLPTGLRSEIDAIAVEIMAEYDRFGVTDFESDRALEIVREVLARHGWIRNSIPG